MKISKRDKWDALNNILGAFFNKKTVSEFCKKLPDRIESKKKPKISTKSTDLLNSSIINQLNASPSLDFIITKAEAELSEGKLSLLLCRLGNYCISTGEFTSAVYIFEKLVAASRGNGTSNKIKADSLLSLGDIFSRQALWGISFNYINEAYHIYRRLESNKGCVDCENLLGSIHGELGDLKQAEIHYKSALLLLNNTKDLSTKGKIEINLGIINNILGNYESALKYFKKALVRFNSLKDLKRIAEISHNLGMLHSKMHNYRLAMKGFDQSIYLSCQGKFLPTLGISYLGKAVVYAIQEDYHMSSLFAEKALEICYKINDKLSIADIYKVKGIIHRDTKNYKLAENYLATSLRINTELKNELNKAETEFELGLLYKNMNRKNDSKSYFIKAKKYFEKAGALKEVKEIDKMLN
jgi:tetratricopeptide (TPR) repeat protein